MRTGAIVVLKPSEETVGLALLTNDGELIALDGVGGINAFCRGAGLSTLVQLQAVTNWETQEKASALYVLHQCEVAQLQ